MGKAAEALDHPVVGVGPLRQAAHVLGAFVTDDNVGALVRAAGFGGDVDLLSIDMDGQDVASLIVQEGFAWDKPEESFGKYRRYQHEAMEANRGLWSDDTKAILSPFCWREPSSEQCNDPQYMP